MSAAAPIPGGRQHNDSLWSELVAAEDARAEAPKQLNTLIEATRFEDWTIRRMAVRALGRLERADLVPSIVPLLTDDSSGVRAEAANALGQAVSRDSADAVTATLLEAMREEYNPHVRGVIAQTLGRLVYRSNEMARVTEHELVEQSFDAEPATVLGVARGLESWVRRQRGNAAPLPATLDRLRQLMAYRSEEAPETAAQVRRLALTALTVAGGVDAGSMESALTAADSELRRLVFVAALAVESVALRETLLDRGLTDRGGTVRYAALRAYGEHSLSQRGCDPVLRATDDPDAHVALLAVDLLGKCPADERAIDRLVELAADGASGRSWHWRAHAIVALAQAAPAKAVSLLPAFTSAPSWWVRMYAARVAGVGVGVMKVPHHLRTLAFDENDNVREAAISDLSRLLGRAADSIYLAQLSRDDYQLLITAANALNGTQDVDRAVNALLSALDRISSDRRETSRDVRMALLRRIGALGGAGRAATFERYLSDFDPVVAAEATRILTEWGVTPRSARPVPLVPQPLPSLREVEELARARPVLVMRDGGEIELELLAFEAPTNAARFARLARAGYFDGLTFHRVVPGFVIQGGSPGANEFMGDGPYTRDELGIRSHTRGTVGLSTRGRDTGDGQIFINLVDNPRLDHNYTIFGKVTSEMEVVDGLLEGAVIARVEWR